MNTGIFPIFTRVVRMNNFVVLFALFRLNFDIRMYDSPPHVGGRYNYHKGP